MAQPHLIDIAKENVISFQSRFERKTEDEKTKIGELKSSLIPSINMEIDSLLKTLYGRWKNRFEISAESEGISLDEFCKLSPKLQIELVCANMNPKYHIYGIRRVDFSNRYVGGLLLYYLAPNMGLSAGNSKYGRFCVNVNLLSTNTDVALEYDSLVHYYDEKNEFDEAACHSDLMPYTRIDLLLADKFTDQISILSVEEIKRTIENDPDPLEIMTTTIINGDSIEAVTISYDDYKYLSVYLNIKQARGVFLDSKEKEDLRSFTHLQRELRKRGIKLKIAKKSRRWDE